MKNLQHKPHYELWTSETPNENGGIEVEAVLHGMFKTEKEALDEAERKKLDPDFNYIAHVVIVFQEPGYHPVMGWDEDYGNNGCKHLWEFKNT